MNTIQTISIDVCDNCGSRDRDTISRSIDFEYNTCANEFRFGRCRDCNLVYIIDRPDVGALGTIYPESYIPYNFNEHLGPLVSRLRNYVQKSKITPITRYIGKKALVVDVGCGSGEFLRLLRDHGSKDWRLAGVDISAQSIAKLEELGVEGVLGRFEDLEWKLPPPDVVVMNQVIEHLDEPKAVVKRSFELLQPGGILMMETPSVDAWDARLFRERHWGGWHTPRHWTLYTPATLKALVESIGFETVEITHLLSPNFWLQSVHHKLIEGGKLSRKVAPYFDVGNPILLPIASLIDVIQLAMTNKTSNFRLVARKPAHIAT